MSRVARRLAPVLIALLLAGAVSPGIPVLSAPDADLITRTFTIQYRGVDDVVALIQPAISERGSYAVQPRIKAVTVTDTRESLRLIETLIAGYDLPPRGISLTVQLLRAEEGPPPGEAEKKPSRRMGVPPSVIQDVTKWGVITQLGGASVSTAENGSGTLAMGEEYRVQFRVGAVSSRLGVIHMDRFALEKLRRGADGSQRFTPLIDVTLNLKAGVTSLVGATSSQDSKQALFVSVTAATTDPAGAAGAADSREK